MARQFVDVNYRLKDPLDSGAGLTSVHVRVAVDELRTFLSVLIRNGARNFDVRPVADNSQKTHTVEVQVDWSKAIKRARRERRSFAGRAWKAITSA